MVSIKEQNKIIEILGNTVRRQILKRLSQEPCFALQIAKDLGFGQQLISQHLRKLAKSGLIYSFYEKSPHGPRRKMYALNKSFSILIDLAPKLFNEKIVSFDTRPDSNDFSSESLHLEKQFNALEQDDDLDLSYLKSSSDLIKQIDDRLDDINAERIALLYIRNIIMQNITEFSSDLTNHNTRRVFHTLINSPDFNLEQISSSLNLREEAVRNIVKQLESKFPDL